MASVLIKEEMTETRETPEQPEPRPPKKRLWFLVRLAVGVALSVTAASLGVAWGARSYVANRLLPQVETTLSEAMDRQVELGELTYIWPWQIDLGQSAIENVATIRAIQIRPDLTRLLQEQELALDIELIDPQVLVMETLDRGWADLQFRLDGEGGGGLPISELNVSVNDAAVRILPLVGPERLVERVQAEATIALNAAETGGIESRLDFIARGWFQDQPLRVTGNFDLGQGQGQVQVESPEVPLDLVLSIVPEIPIERLTGEASVDLTIDWERQSPLGLDGEFQVSDATLDLEPVPLPLENVTGRIYLEDRVLRLEQVEARYGQIPLEVEGPIRWGQAVAATPSDSFPDPGSEAIEPTGPADPGYRLQAKIDALSIDELLDTFTLEAPLPVAGQITADVFLRGALNQPEILGQFQSIAPGQIDQLTLTNYSGRFQLNGSQLAFDQLRGTAAGGQIQGLGQVNLGPNPLSQFGFEIDQASTAQLADAYGASLPRSLGSLNADVQLEVAGSRPLIQANWQLSGGEITGSGLLQVESGIVEIPQSTLALGGGTATASARLEEDQIDAEVAPRDVALSFFNLDQPGTITGDFTLQMDRQNLTLASLQAAGTAELPQGFGPIPGPIQGQVAWNGSGLEIDQARVFDLATVAGQIPIDPRTFEVGPLDLSLQANQVTVPDLQRIPQLSSILEDPGFAVQGELDLDAQLTGALESLRLEGDLALRDTQISELTFANLQGPVVWDPNQIGTQVNLQGNGDQISFNLDPNLQAFDFRVQQGSILATGEREGDQLALNVESVPLQLLAAIISSDPNQLSNVSGDLDTQIQVNLADKTAQGEATLETVDLPNLQLEQVKTSFAYQPGQISVPEASLELFDSTYQASGTVILPGSLDPNLPSSETGVGTESNVPQLDVQIVSPQGRLQDIVSAFKWQRWSDITSRGFNPPPLGPATLVADTMPIDLTPLPLVEQLERYNEFLDQYTEAIAEQMDPLFPPPTAVEGDFQAKIQISGPITQPMIGFSFDGSHWAAEEFQVETIRANGTYANQQITFQEFTLQSGDRSGTFTGQVGLNEQQGSLQIANFPLTTLDRFLPDRLQLAGDLDLTADLAGNLQDPEVEGNLTVLNARVNRIPLESAEGDFAYREGQLRLRSQIQTTAPEPIQISGVIPYTLPFVETGAASDQIELDVRAQNGGLQLFSLVSDQVSWDSGSSQLDVAIRGTLEEPSIQGTLSVQEAQVNLAALPEPITNLQGQIRFNFDALEVQNLSGQFSQGSLSAAGVLPINSEGIQTLDQGAPPLTLQLNQLQLDLPQLYTGQADGQITVAGLLLKPLLGGEVTLSHGQVDVSPRQPEASDPDQSAASDPELTDLEVDPDLSAETVLNQPGSTPTGSSPGTGAGSSGSSESSGSSDSAGAGSLLAFNGLMLRLGDNIEIVRGQLFEFVASGNLNIYGTAADLQPAGTIELERGGINLPLASFRLDRSRPNRAVFDLDNGLDPFLDLRLTTKVTEFFQNNNDLIPFDPAANPAVGTQQTIDIFATVQGRASELSVSDPDLSALAITSNPPRSEEEIVALLGQNALALLGSGPVTGLAGSAIVSNFQTVITDNLGVDDVRLAPIPQVSTDAPNRFSVGLGLEIGKDLGPDLSVSAQQNLTDSFQPTRYNFRYQLGPNTLTRFSTDLRGNDSASVEFETRF